MLKKIVKSLAWVVTIFYFVLPFTGAKGGGETLRKQREEKGQGVAYKK